MGSERLRVVQVLEAALGGTKKHLLDLCSNLDTGRFELHAVISPVRDPDPNGTRRRLEAAGVQVRQVPMQRGLAPPSDRECLREIADYLNQVRPHILHAHSAKAGLLGRLAARHSGVRGVIYTPHGFPFRMWAPWPVVVSALLMERWLGRGTTCVIAVCESERQVALQARVVPPERCVAIPNGIELSAPPAVDRARKLQELGLPVDARVILCVGDLRPQKGHCVAVRAMERVVREAPAAHLVIAGDGRTREASVRRLVRQHQSRWGSGGHVHFIGARDDVPELLAVCDVFCLPSLWEGCPYALLEAAAAERPLVGSDIPGITDVIREGHTGWLARPGDPEQLASALLDALDDPVAARARALAARELVVERHSLADMVARTAWVYEQVAGGAPVADPPWIHGGRR